MRTSSEKETLLFEDSAQQPCRRRLQRPRRSPRQECVEPNVIDEMRHAMRVVLAAHRATPVWRNIRSRLKISFSRVSEVTENTLRPAPALSFKPDGLLTGTHGI
jgi:hypothetical protein